MPVPSLPKVGTPPAPAPLRKIALEEHFGHPIVFMRDSDGRFETRKEAKIGHLGPEYFEVVQKRLLDFDATRLQAMDEAGVDKVLLSFGAGFRTFGVQGILDRIEASGYDVLRRRAATSAPTKLREAAVAVMLTRLWGESAWEASGAPRELIPSSPTIEEDLAWLGS